ncbi:hypothetical protein BH09MYX1_BH09MYX1_31450 [soil metagenome]
MSSSTHPPPGTEPAKTPSLPPKAAWRPSSRSGGPSSQVDWQRLWISLQKRKWQTLGILGGSSGMKSSPMEVASILADVGWQHLGQPIQMLDLRETPLNLVETRLGELRKSKDRGDRVFVVLSPISDNPATIAIAPHVDALVLCLVLGVTPLKDASNTVAELGHDRFLGSVVLKNPVRVVPKPSPKPKLAGK